jgi:hypothetical protein
MAATMHNKAKSGISIYPALKRIVSAGFLQIITYLKQLKDKEPF